MKRSHSVVAALLGACLAYAGAVLAAPGATPSGSPAPSARIAAGIAVAAPLSNQELALLEAKEASDPSLLDRAGAGCTPGTDGCKCVVGRHHMLFCSTPTQDFVGGCVLGGLLGGLFGSFGGVYGAMTGAGVGCVLIGVISINTG